MKSILIAILLISCLGCQKPYNKSNSSYYHSIPTLWQVQTSEIIIDKNLAKREKEYEKWLREQNVSGTSKRKITNGS
tara:strand:+ start:70 stop:300 length:231 start_codon:yes stop_codon:yes gene_type:complete